jgi:hypothetical protein
VASGIKTRAPLTAVNATRWALYEVVADADLPLEASAGGCAKYRARESIPKAARVSEAGTLVGWQISSTAITTCARGDHCGTKLAAQGSHAAIAYLPKSVQVFKAGGMVRAEAPEAKKAAIHARRAAVRAGGSFREGNAGAVNARYCKLIHRADGSGYGWRPALPPPAEAGALKRGRRG